MEEAIAGSPGWSESGGPWVPASQGMKKYVWSETDVEGGKPFTGTLAHPPSNTGAFQNMNDPRAVRPVRACSAAIPQFYADAAVVAYQQAGRRCVVESLHAEDHVERRLAGSCDADRRRPGEDDRDSDSGRRQSPRGFSMNFLSPQTIRAITFVTKDPSWIDASVSLESALRRRPSKPATTGRTSTRWPSSPASEAPEHTISFPPSRRSISA